MSIQPSNEPVCQDHAGVIELIIEPRPKDLGAFQVRRALPAEKRQRLGPFIFFDHMGPAELGIGAGMDVRPHPHIGIATVTYLFEGEIMHRDSLGFQQPIRPGAVNWMTAGRGIVHSERSPETLVDTVSNLHGIQTWLALPIEDEETEPDFTHYPADSIPATEIEGVGIRLIAGEAFGLKSPVRVASETLYAAVQMPAGRLLRMPPEVQERGVYVVDGFVEIGGEEVSPGTMAVLAPGTEPELTAREASMVMLLGGAPLPGDRTLYWNFVSSRPERIEQAKEDWRQGHFDVVPGETEFIPLPDD